MTAVVSPILRVSKANRAARG